MEIRLPNARVATGLYSHWDSFVSVNKDVMKWIKSSKKTKPKKTRLNSIEEVVYTLDKAVRKGGEEFLISENVYNELKSIFPKRKKRTGGNGNNMGRTLLSLGMKPLVSYPLRPERLMLASPNFRVAVKDKITIPKKVVRDDPEYEHIIFEFKKGRHILTWNPAESKGVFDNDFLKFACDSKRTDILIIAYAHLLLPEYKKRTDVVVEKLRKNRPKVHLEFGSGSEASMKYAIEEFSEHECCDSFGMDEKECKIYFKSRSESQKDLEEAALKAVKEYGINRICVHAPQFAFSVSKNNAKKELDALQSACLVASSSTGIKPSVKTSKKKIGNYNICLVKNKINEKPRTMTGLGDAFAAVQAVKSLL
jgi:ADP-dependent phosphofructokinase/glucokinase